MVNHPYVAACLLAYLYRHEIIVWAGQNVPNGIGQHPVQACALVGVLCLTLDYYTRADDYHAFFADACEALQELTGFSSGGQPAGD